MPARLFAVVGFVLIGFGTATQVSADWFCGIFNGIAREVKRRQCWPEPFVGPDRAAARAPYAVMVANGWQRQNMLGEYHFEAGTGQLTEAGKLKLRWILTAAPQQHRGVFVHRANTDEETMARMAAVYRLASQIAPNDLPSVQPTSISDDGWPADQVEMIGRKFQATTPPPRLPAPASSSTSSGTGGSN
jgi:hypothetical protein